MLPLPNETFELVINRHESYWIPEAHRILKPRGIFLTQQVGPADCIQLNEFLCAPTDADFGGWTLQDEVQQMEQLGFRILRREEEFLDSVFYDVGAVVFYLKVIAWQIPDFAVEKYRDRLLAMHALIEKEGAFFAKSHRFLIEAHKR